MHRNSFIVAALVLVPLLSGCQAWRDMRQSSWIAYTTDTADRPIAYSIAKDESDYAGEYFIMDPAHPTDLGRATTRVAMLEPTYRRSGTTFTATAPIAGEAQRIHLVYDTHDTVDEIEEVYAVDVVNDRELVFRKGLPPAP